MLLRSVPEPDRMIRTMARRLQEKVEVPERRLRMVLIRALSGAALVMVTAAFDLGRRVVHVLALLVGALCSRRLHRR